MKSLKQKLKENDLGVFLYELRMREGMDYRGICRKSKYANNYY